MLQVSSTKRTPSTTTPTFDKESAESYFQEVYDASSHSYTRPDWLPESPPPTTAFNEDPISRSEVEEVIKHTRSTFSASPLDQVSHRALKHCPSLMPALIDLYNCCWETGSVPQAWRDGIIRLIPKVAAKESPAEPSNFRPIALTFS